METHEFENWAELHRCGRFAVLGLLYSDQETIKRDKWDNVKMALVQGYRLDEPHAKRWITQRVIIRCTGYTFRGGHNNYKDVANGLKAACDKFDRLYPCHFLAKEWPEGMPHGLHDE